MAGRLVFVKSRVDSLNIIMSATANLAAKNGRFVWVSNSNIVLNMDHTSRDTILVSIIKCPQ